MRRSRAPRMSEDCLYINVWAPATSRAGGWPVIVWSGGGAFTTGGGSFVEEDPARLAARGAVVVTFNYRLGVFGFLAHRALTAESPVGASGNYGLMDHIAALRWVRANIGEFGGDVRSVTYMAESSGAAAGLLLLTTPTERNLFDRAILLSPGSVTPLLTLAEAEQSAAALDTTAEQLRDLPADDVLAIAKDLTPPPSNLSVARPLRPIVDGWLIESDDAFSTGDFEAVPIVVVTNEDEGRFFTRRMKLTGLDDYTAYMSGTFGESARAAAALYPADLAADVPAAVAAAYGDVSINHPADRIVRAFARRERRTFRGVYTYRAGATSQPPTHSEEAATFLDSRADGSTADAEMAAIVGRYVLSFAEHGEPGTVGSVEWPRYESREQRHLQLDLPPSVGRGWRGEQLSFLFEVLSDDTSALVGNEAE